MRAEESAALAAVWKVPLPRLRCRSAVSIAGRWNIPVGQSGAGALEVRRRRNVADEEEEAYPPPEEGDDPRARVEVMMVR